MVGSKNIFLMSYPLIFNFQGFLGPFSRVNSEIPNARIFKHTILELSYEMDSKNMRHTFETFFFSNPAKGHCVTVENIPYYYYYNIRVK